MSLSELGERAARIHLDIAVDPQMPQVIRESSIRTLGNLARQDGTSSGAKESLAKIIFKKNR